jgi:Right handed beta helix region
MCGSAAISSAPTLQALENYGNGLGLDAASSVWVSDNVISANNGGIHLRGVSSAVHIERNIIGRNAAGSAGVPNNGIGIFVSENSFGHPGNNILNVDIVDNLVANNTCSGDCAGILIGASHADNNVQGIRLSGNRVFANKGLEIDLGVTNATNNGLILGVTENDTDDPDTGGNTLQNFPVLTDAVGNGNQVAIDFTLNTEASKTFTLEFFHTASCDDPGGHGGAEKFLGGDDFATDVFGDVAGHVVYPLSDLSGFITATATNSVNGTSEFSLCKSIAEGVLFENGFEDGVP